MRLHRYRLIISALLGGCYLGGCAPDRVAGTEVGNPELTISARFAIQGTGDSMSIPQMEYKCMGMAYHNVNDSSGMLWTTPLGYLIDAADSVNGSILSTVKRRTGSWARAEMMLKSPAGDSTLPDFVSFEAFSNPRYLKMIKRLGADSIRFLFEMPQAMELKLLYDKAHIDTWLHKDTLAIEIMFDAGKWAAGLTLEPSVQVRKDFEGRDYVLLSPLENIKTYEHLKTMLPLGFMADSTEMH